MYRKTMVKHHGYRTFSVLQKYNRNYKNNSYIFDNQIIVILLPYI